MILHYEEHGNGPTIVLLHGFLSSSKYWSHIVPELEKHYHVITIDLLGFGDSPKPKWSDYSLKTHTSSVVDTIQAVLGDKPFILVGHSMGALIASEVSKTMQAGKVDKLVLLNMPLFSGHDQARKALRRTGPLYRMTLYTSAGRIFWPVIRAIARTRIAQAVAKTYSPAVEGLAKNIHTSRIRSLQNTIEVTNGVELLQSLSVSTHLVGGTRDRPIYRQNIKSVSLPGHIKASWVQTGHHTPITRPSVLVRLLQQ